MSDAPILITGGAGFIGSHLADALLAKGYAVRVLDNLSTGKPENLPMDHSRIELIEGDVADAALVQHDLQGRLPLKKRLRRLIQFVLAGRRWPSTGEDEFFRKAVRRHELFWVRHL